MGVSKGDVFYVSWGGDPLLIEKVTILEINDDVITYEYNTSLATCELSHFLNVYSRTPEEAFRRVIKFKINNHNDWIFKWNLEQIKSCEEIKRLLSLKVEDIKIKD